MRSQTLPDDQDAEGSQDKNPDGGYGWAVVIGAFLMVVTSYGTSTAWGVMQDYYEREMFGDTIPDAQLQLSFVGTFALIFANACGPLAQVLRSMWGTRFVLLIGTFLIAIGLIIAGFSNQIWHLYLTQGILFGTGVSLMYVTIMAVAPQYFDRKRGLALGIVASGSGIGGLVMPFIMTPLNRSLGAGWTYRVVGFVCLGCDLLACLLVKDRFKLPKQRKSLSEIIRLDVFKDKNFCIWSLGACVQMLGYYIPYFFLPSYATWVGLSPSEGSSLVAVSSAVNFAGRIVAGILADRFGLVNINSLFLMISGLSTLLIWTFAYDFGTLMAFSVIFGFFCGSYFSLGKYIVAPALLPFYLVELQPANARAILRISVSPITLNILGMERFPSGLSLVLITNIISVFGPNISSAIDGSAGAEPFFAHKMFAGVAFILGSLIMLWLKFSMNRKLFAKV
ncbi:major facilitator superfamily domain-containing protein [Zychaea mexicana]|uniref:major facilitator superfamily domain-containing protein n=1 Tax=Zychaea mexicana TaxID=64656 RepID=UPI0022FE4EEF|nr:major facilitator superfamily domain-containing protein [Zychaea mexicana]KAI9496140.1 major facilitator superfamily domain-containing protein [Zychaea mexicana]